MNAADKIERLKQKRLALDREIAEFEALAARRVKVADLAADAGILALPDAVLQTVFAKLAAENPATAAKNSPAVSPKPPQNPSLPAAKPTEKGGPTA